MTLFAADVPMGFHRARPPVRVLLDFDGTVTLTDTVDRLLERFALPQWRDIERDWERGRIGSYECLQQQTALLRATPAALDEEVDHVAVDGGAITLARCCGDRSLDLLVVSDGYDRVIRRVLGRLALPLPFISNVLVSRGQSDWTLLAPASREVCRVGAAHCKCARADHTGRTVLIGDGRSDFCVAHAVDFVIAKGALARHCAQHHLPHVTIENLRGATDALESWLPTIASAHRAAFASGELA